MDVNIKEEMCASSRVSLAINEEGQTLSISKDVQGGIPYYKLYDVIMVSPCTSISVFILVFLADGSRGIKRSFSQTQLVFTGE